MHERRIPKMAVHALKWHRDYTILYFIFYNKTFFKQLDKKEFVVLEYNISNQLYNLDNLLKIRICMIVIGTNCH